MGYIEAFIARIAQHRQRWEYNRFGWHIGVGTLDWLRNLPFTLSREDSNPIEHV